MKKYAIFLVFFLTGCAGLMKGGFPSPRAGLVGVVNSNRAYAHCSLFADSNWSENDLLTVDEQGRPKLAVPMITQFTVDTVTYTYEHNAQLLYLPYPADYTLYVIWTRVNGVMLDRSIVSFSTSGDPFNDEHIDRYGLKTYADKFVYLPSINTSGLTHLSITTTIPIADYLAGLLGIRPR